MDRNPGHERLSQRVRRASRQRRQAARAAAREAILQAASELLLELGYEAFSLRKLAERVGYTAPTIYRHFADKDALLYAITEEGFRLFTVRLQTAAAGMADPFDRLEATAIAYIDFGLEHPVQYRVLFMQRPDLLWRRSPDHAGSRMQTFGLLRTAVHAALGPGGATGAHMVAASNALWAQTHGTVALALSIPHMPPRQARAFGALGVGAIIKGLRR